MAKRDAGGRNVGASKVRQFRCSDELWEAAQAKAETKGETLSDVLRALLADYVGDKSIPVMAESEWDFHSASARAQRESEA
ncbi:hypothetical protein [Nocardioides albus]|uniref:Antitoxin component of RelBE/YafQ-DinJ toxin-antitoxin module n=1 Tax=Nocardioides albus TaxID=1841 RepID=A0A7W5A314_9ACTN|nr:hypothetical protein [Nocardioides albus]MBB3088545.1 antitoxin component of RelBE/YafQ-DinJ toxin-antitoxin module [Nocardioides albus]